MDQASIDVACQLRHAVETGCLPEGTVLYLSTRAPHLTYEQRLAVIDGLRRTGYASRTTPPEVQVPPAVRYAIRLKAEVLPHPEIVLSVPLLIGILGRDRSVTESAQLLAIQKALLILKDAGLVYTKNRKFLRS